MRISKMAELLVIRKMFDNTDEAEIYIKAMRKYQRECKKLGINITEHGGKLLGFYSISTSPLKNKRCKNRAKNPSLICFYCYSMAYQEFRKGLRQALIENTKLLTKSIIDIPPLPQECKYFRIESYGDLLNTIQAENYIKFIRENPHVYFGWWSKNMDIIAKIEHFEKPVNCNLIHSSARLNICDDINKLLSFVDKVFTVYDRADVSINCGARNCSNCLKCYTKNNITFLNERKK